MTDQPNSLLASAAVLTAESTNDPVKLKQSWMDEAWEQYDDHSGELYFGTTWFANTMSRGRLIAAVPPERMGDEPTPLESGPAVDALERLAGGVAGQSRMLHSFGVHLSIPGICYLTGIVDELGVEEWSVKSSEELRVKQKRFEYEVDRNKWLPLPDDSLVVKVWRHHERRHWLPDSPARHALPILRELSRINAHITATLVSRLAGAGMLILPNGMTFPTKPENLDKPDPFLAELMEVMLTPIKDPGNASAVVPFYIKVPDELVGKVQHITFSTPLDDRVLELRAASIRRLATVLDMPAEILTGMGDINHWGQWFTEESGIKSHVTPALELISHALTIGYMRPMTAGTDQQDAVVWYDTSELTTRPDRSADAILGYDRMEISGNSLRRETGFGEEDKPDQAELKQMAAVKLLTSPLTAAAGMEMLGFAVPAASAPVVAEAPPLPVGPLPTPPELPTPENTPPAPDAALLVADGFVTRALEKAGNRVRSLRKGKLSADQDCPPATMHECLGGVETCGLDPVQLLDGAWERIPEIAVHLGVDPARFRQSLDLYARGLLVSGEAHSLIALAAFLAAERETA